MIFVQICARSAMANHANWSVVSATQWSVVSGHTQPPLTSCLVGWARFNVPLDTV